MTVTAADLRVKRIRPDPPAGDTIWSVTWPGTAHNRGRSYHVTVHPDSSMTIRTAIKGQAVTDRVAERIEPLIREAIGNYRT
jgi:hypothetical protein